jgi:shikimate dehydrogenase
MPSAKSKPASRWFGIIGYPLRHSGSPDLHNSAFKACALPYVYAPLPLSPAHLKQGVAALRTLGASGFNVTLPHKEAVVPLIQSASPLVRTLGAANTVLRRPRGWHGENTDVHGFSVPLWKHRRRLSAAPAVVIGSGGAARAVVYALIRHFRVATVLVLVRNQRRAELFLRWADSLAPTVPVSPAEIRRVSEWRAAFAEAAIVVNATPVGGEAAPGARLLPAAVAFGRHQIAYDLVYGRRTAFLAGAATQGALALSGDAMLFEQAAAAFELFTGVRFPRNRLKSTAGRNGP